MTLRNSNSIRLTQLPFFVKKEHDLLEEYISNAESQIMEHGKKLPFEQVTTSMTEIRSCLISSRKC